VNAFAERWSYHVAALALVLGLAASTAVHAPNAGAVGALAAAAVLVARAARDRQRAAAVALGLTLAGWAWGSARLDALDRSFLESQIGSAGYARAVVTGPVRRSRFELRMPARIVRFRGQPLRETVQLELRRGRSPPQGARLVIFGRVVAPRSDADFDERTWLARRGVHVVFSAETWRQVGTRGGVGGVGDALRRELLSGLAGVRGERRAVLAGIVLGEDEGLSDALRDAFRASGLYHLLAVSGQNVAFLAFGIIGICWLVGLSRLWAHALVLLAIAGYVLAVGWQPSVVRAGVAGGLASLAWLTARERDRWWLLLAGAVVLLAWNPYSLLDAGFQLSFVAVAAIFVLAPRVLTTLDGYPLPSALAEAIAISVACGLATAPVLWLQFGAVPLYSVVANALAAPVVGSLLGLALVAALLHPILPAAAFALAWIDSWLAAYLVACARLVARLPFAQLTGTRELAVVGALAVGAWLWPRLRAPRAFRLVALASLAAVVALAWAAARPDHALPPPSGLRLTFLDVGQGDGCLVEAPGVRILVDEGAPEARVADQLRRLGIRWLSAMVLTHPQRDHVGGAAGVLRTLRVGALFDPRIPNRSASEHDALREARARHVPVLVARAGAAYRFGALRLRILWPDGPGGPSEDPNQHAVVLVVSYGSVDALLTADAESDVTLPLDPPPVEILKVAHHGSSDDGLAELLERIRPRIAVISVGLGNDYGHPTPSTLATLERAPGLQVYRTDLDGPVTVESDGRRLWIREER